MVLYLTVRRAHFQDGLSGRQIVQDIGISRDSVAKVLTISDSPGYRRTALIKRSGLESYVVQIIHLLAEDTARARKLYHMHKRICERLRDDCG